jgi:uncharacterized membrane protein
VTNRSGPVSGTPAAESVLATSAREAHALEEEENQRQTLQDRVATRITRLTGSMTFVAFNAIWFVVWIAINLPGSPIQFDPFPFSFLTMIVSLEAIGLSIFVLISENSQARRADRLARLEMQVNVIAEREITKLVNLVSEIHEHLGLAGLTDFERREMATETHGRRSAIGPMTAAPNLEVGRPATIRCGPPI